MLIRIPSEDELMSDVSIFDARKNLAQILKRVSYEKERVVLTRYGKQVAAIVPMADLDLLSRLRQVARSRDVADALSELERGESVSWNALREELKLP